MEEQMFNIHDPKRDDLEETLRELMVEAQAFPGRSVYKSIGHVEEKLSGVFDSYMGHVRNQISLVGGDAARVFSNEHGGTYSTFLTKSKHYLEDEVGFGKGEWVTEYFLSVRRSR